MFQVLELMKEVSDDMEEGDTSDLSPYHSDDCDSAVMMSGNSPFISKTARYNFLSRSVRYLTCSLCHKEPAKGKKCP